MSETDKDFELLGGVGGDGRGGIEGELGILDLTFFSICGFHQFFKELSSILLSVLDLDFEICILLSSIFILFVMDAIPEIGFCPGPGYMEEEDDGLLEFLTGADDSVLGFTGVFNIGSVCGPEASSELTGSVNPGGVSSLGESVLLLKLDWVDTRNFSEGLEELSLREEFVLVSLFCWNEGTEKESGVGWEEPDTDEGLL